MNVFIPYSNITKIIECLDSKRLNKQILECQQMLNALGGQTNAYRNHPCTLIYADYQPWLYWYMRKFKAWQTKDFDVYDALAEPERPPFIGHEPLHNAHKARLYQKDPVLYERFKRYANFTNMNWYVVSNEIKKYKDGKLIEVEKFKS